MLATSSCLLRNATLRARVLQACRPARRFSYEALSKDDVAAAQAKLVGWDVVEQEDGSKTVLSKTFEFADFVGAWGFMSKVALQVRVLLLIDCCAAVIISVSVTHRSRPTSYAVDSTLVV